MVAVSGMKRIGGLTIEKLMYLSALGVSQPDSVRQCSM